MVSGPQHDEVVAKLEALIGDLHGDGPQVRKRRQILRAATELFVAQGYRKTSVAEVATASGVAKGTVYLYYKTKTDLLFAAVAMEKLEFLGRFAALFDNDLPARTRLQTWIFGALTIASIAPLSARLLCGDRELAAVFADAPAAFLESQHAEGEAMLAELVTEAAAPHELPRAVIAARVRALSVTLMTGPQLHAMAAIRGPAPDTLSEELTELLLDGLTAPVRTS